MRSFNPFAARFTSRATHDTDLNFSAAISSSDTAHSPLHTENAAFPSIQCVGNLHSMEDAPLDDFDRQLLAEAERTETGSLATATLYATENPRPILERQRYASDLGRIKASSGGDFPPTRKVEDHRHSGPLPFRLLETVPFSSPTLAVKQRKSQLSKGKDNPYIRNSFHEKLERSKEEAGQDLGWIEQKAEHTSISRKEIAGPTVRGIDLVPTTRLPDKQRSIFKFPIFNAVQSRCFPTAYESEHNLVVSAPTGSGKTVIMELGILRLIDSLKNGRAKVVYQAPTKSLCSERYLDWQRKFGVFDIQCAEFTGDTEHFNLKNMANASIIVTTPEKWDSVTRKWKDNAKLMNMIKLFLVDEVHILKDTRGATLEAIVSRMKAVGNSVRFIALSATIPNSEDIAAWLTRNEQARHLPAIRETFDDTFRPVQLEKHILGHDGPYHPFKFDAALTEKIPDVVSKYGKGKPVMVFCPTKESAQKTATRLAQSWLESVGGKRPWNGPRSVVTAEHEILQKTLPAAVAFHHASLTPADRKAVEQGYLGGDIRIVCSTSTLAVGVNLPCYLVILKGTQGYTDAGIQEYSSLEVMQMLGRAGRPQFESEACAVILCLNNRLSKYEKMVAGEEVLESSLHQNLTEHLNAEIGLGTIDSIASAKKWLSSTFLNVRLQKNPRYYNLEAEDIHLTPDEALLQWCENDLKLLTEADLIEDNDSTLRGTEFGDIMARYCIKFETMKTFMAIPAQAKMSEVLGALCQAIEFREFRLRSGDKTFYKGINKANETRYPIQVDIALPQHKVSLIIQAKLGCVPIEKDPRGKLNGGQLRQLGQDTNNVINYAKRLIRCMVDIFVQRNDSFAVKSALELARGLAAGVWDGTVMQLKQIPGIGDVFTRKLAVAGVKDIDTLFNTEPHRIEVILSKNPPFGLELISKAADFPMLHISVKGCGQTRQPGKGVAIKLRCEVGILNEKIPLGFNKRAYNILFLCETSYGELVEFRRFRPARLKTMEEILLTSTIDRPGAKVRCHIMCDNIAGTHRFAELDIDCPTSWFPSKTSAPTIGFHRPQIEFRASIKAPLEEFDSEGVDDSDLLGAMSQSIGTRVVEDIDDIMADVEGKQHSRKRSLRTTSDDESGRSREPQKLANGKWMCKHTCKEQGKECKHLCCREGVKKKPNNKKQRKDTMSIKSNAELDVKDGQKKNEKKKQAKQPPRNRTVEEMFQQSNKNITSESSSNTSIPRPATEPESLRDSKSSSRSISSSRKTLQNTKSPRGIPDPQQVVDAFDSGDFDWQAMDELAATLEPGSAAGRTDSHKHNRLDDSEYNNTTDTRHTRTIPTEPTIIDTCSDLHALFFSGSSSAHKQAVSYEAPGTPVFVGGSRTSSASQLSASSVDFNGTHQGHNTPHSQVMSSSTPKCDRTNSIQAIQSRILDKVPKAEETTHEREERLEMEQQRRRWAELNSDLLTYETFGQYVRIVDDGN